MHTPLATFRDGVADHWRADDAQWTRGVIWTRGTREVTLWWAHRSDRLCRSGDRTYKGHTLLGRADERAAADRMARDALSGLAAVGR